MDTDLSQLVGNALNLDKDGGEFRSFSEPINLMENYAPSTFEVNDATSVNTNKRF